MPKVEEYVQEELSVFSEKPMQLAVLNNSNHVYQTINSLEKAQTLEFQSPAFNDQYKDLSTMFLKLTLQILKSDGTKYSSTNVAQPLLASNPASSLFKSAVLAINNQIVRNIDSNYGIKELLETKVNFDETALKGRLAAQMYYENESADYVEMTKDSKEFEVCTKLNICNVSKYLIPMCSLNLKLHLGNPDYLLLEKEFTVPSNSGGDATTASTSSIIKIVQAQLTVRHIVPREAVMLSIERVLSSGVNALYQYTGGKITTFNIAAGTSQINIPALFSGIKPRMAIFTSMDNDVYSGNKKTPWKFNNSEIKRFNFVLNGISQPNVALEMQTGSGKYASAFTHMYDALNYHQSKRSNLITCKSFADNNFFIFQDLTNSHTALDDVIEPAEHCVLGVYADLLIPIVKAQTIILYTMSDLRFEISANRTVTVIQ